jgi:chromosome segregation ATPase
MRIAVIAFALLLVVGAIACYTISSQTVAKAKAAATLGAKGVADGLLTPTFAAVNLSTPVSSSIAKEIDDALQEGAFGSSGFDEVTIWSDVGEVLYSTDRNRLNDQVPSETAHLQRVLEDGASSQVVDGTFSSFAPLSVDSRAVVAQLDRPYAPIAEGGRPLRLATGLFVLLFTATIFIMYRLSRSIASSVANAAFRPTTGLGQVSQAPQEPGRSRRGEERPYAQPGFREESEARRRAEERATALEEQVALLQEQYRNSLGDLQATQRKLQEAVTSGTGPRPDSRLEERVLKAEGQARLLEAQLTATSAERDKLANEVTEARREEADAGGRSDPEAERRMQRLEQESIALRAELEGTRTELDVAKRELATHQTRANDLAVEIESARRTASDAEGLHAEVERLRLREREAEQMRIELDVLRPEAERVVRLAKDLDLATAARQESDRSLEASRAELQASARELEEARAEITGLRSAGETRATALDEELRLAKAAAEEVRAELQAARSELATAHEGLAGLRSEHESARGALSASQAQLESMLSDHTSARAELTAAQSQLEVTLGEHASMRAELKAYQSQLESTLGELGAARAEMQSARADADAIRTELEHSRTRHADEIAAKETELQQRVAANRAELQAELESIEQDLKTKLEATVVELRDEIGAAGERAAQAEGELRSAHEAAEERDRTLRTREQELAAATAELDALRSGMTGVQQDAASIRAELERSKSELESARLNAEQAETELRAMKIAAAAAQEDLEATRLGATQAGTELQTAREQLAAAESLRSELDALRTALDAANDELASLRTEKSDEENELAHAHAEMQAARRELEAAEARIGTMGAELEVVRSEAAARELEVETTRAHLAEVEVQAGGAHDEATKWQTRMAELQGELEAARAELLTAQAEIQTELTRGVEVAARAEQSERELAVLREQQMSVAAAGADQEDLQEVLRVAQERLAAQTDKLNETEDHAHAAERQLQETLVRLEHAESEAQRVALERATIADADGAATAVGDPLEDRRGSSPFVKELSMDAKKSLTQILGLTLTLKHKKSAQEQAPFLRQLSAMVKRLDRTVSDLSEADKLARGEIELNNRRTNLEALIERVVEESGVGTDHDVRVETEELVVALDPIRIEQILNGLLRTSADRTSPGAQITVRLAGQNGGAMLSVEDKETSSDGSISPVVVRLANVMGGWASVESRPNGGSSFRVFIPDANGHKPASSELPAEDADAAEDTLQITVKNPQEESGESQSLTEEELDLENDPWAAGQLLMQELQRLSHQEGK